MENWKQIDDRYEVSDTGLVRNYQTGRILKQQENQRGQLTVLLSDNGNDKRILVSRLVAKSFISNPNNLPVVMHMDDNTYNNVVSNLKWGTQQDNIDDMYNKGRSKRILTNLDVVNIRAMHPLKSYKQIADIYNVSKSAIAPIIQNKRYKTI
jgi:hypothetical protein